jgi:hypothetical protein
MNKLMLGILSLIWLALLPACTSTTPVRDATFGDATRMAKDKIVITPDYGHDDAGTTPMAIELGSGIKAYQNNTLVNQSGKAENPALVESISNSD